MPKGISAYKHLEEDPPKRISTSAFMIGTIFLLFCFSVCRDCSTQITQMDEELTDKSKLCLVEFTQKKCDLLNPSGECQKLLECQEEKGKWERDRFFEAGKILCQEVLNDYAFPTVMTILVLLLKMTNTFNFGKKGEDNF